jgi:hypothetical protein
MLFIFSTGSDPIPNVNIFLANLDDKKERTWLHLGFPLMIKQMSFYCA